jgi:hypothetical protein
MRGAFSDDPGLIHRLMDPLDVVFPGIRRGAASRRRAWALPGSRCRCPSGPLRATASSLTSA